MDYITSTLCIQNAFKTFLENQDKCEAILR